MDAQFRRITSRRVLPAESVRKLLESGFLILGGAVSAGRLAQVSAAYDKLMASGSGPDFNVGSTTTRLYFAEHWLAFEEIYQCPLLLESCAHLIGEPFKLSSLLGRSLRAGSPAQALHLDVGRDSPDAPMAGFILILDAFQPENGATRFVPGSQNWPDVPSDRLTDPRLEWGGEVLACGAPGSMIVFDGAVWHGHTANATSKARRSIQGYFVRRSVMQGLNFSGRMLPGTRSRISAMSRYLLEL